MPVRTDVEISRANIDDVPAIKEIAEQWRIGDRDESDLMDRGFLVSDFTIDDYKHLVASSDYCFVARRGDKVVGFLLAYSQDTLKVIDDTTADWVGTRLDDFVVVKQVAVAPSETGNGIGRELYYHLISLVRGKGLRLVAAVVDTPLNVRSRAFHRTLGFTEAFSLRHTDGRMRSIWVYSTTAPDNEVLATQYQVAVGLYTHEDTLNWHKLQHYLYVTVATAAALGFVLGLSSEQTPSLDTTLVGVVLCLIGIITSFGFAVALYSGVVYLAVRKQAVAEIEDAYINRDGIRVVSRMARVRPLLHRSPTTWVLRLTPIVGLVLWVAALVYLLLVSR
ncbi:GNAT family N-acetyltransferase [Thermobispora bispora]|uniref:GNAT family N-acetyltransferase n=1 Tax=Thermobispora bispora TaxID=2006 RepID=UPI00197D6380|nr:GNAT family N-acetyltransferase [Thermobispora bispora]QSI47738.1 GNAT family N-acetyltransferase [Thermobispora bispora]